MPHPRLPRVKEMEFWSAVPLAESAERAAELVGVSSSAGRRWFRDAGGVKPQLSISRARLTFQERCRIEALRAAGLSQAEIARRLDRHPGTVSRELRRNRGVRVGAVYGASNAQSKADGRARRAKPTKLSTNLRLRRQVQYRLKQNHSPEQIAARLMVDFPGDAEMRVSHETIYKALYVQGRGGLKRELTTHLRTGRKLRKPQRQVGEGRGRIPDMVNISQRPPEVEDRAVPGHWEGDLILGSTGSSSAIGTLVERATGFVMLLHLRQDHTAPTVAQAMIDKMSQLPQILRQTLTWDQGAEMANHAQIATATNLKIYFCDPHSPWQRGSNENTNGLLRQYFPKSTDLSRWGPGYLDLVATELNNRPRKRLSWQTPAEALDQLLSPTSEPPDIALTG